MKPFTEQEQQQLNIDFKFLMARRVIEGQSTADPDDFQVIAVRAAQYGALQPGSVSAWVRAMVELEREGIIKLRASSPRTIEVTRDFRLKVASMSASDVRIAYQRDPEFRKQWDAMSLEDENGTVRQVAEVDEPVELTALQYRSMDPTVLARLLQAPSTRDKWQAAINKLIAAGSI